MSVLTNTILTASLEQRLDSTITLLERIAVALERIAPKVEEHGDDSPDEPDVTIDDYEPEVIDESVGLDDGNDDDNDRRSET